MENSGFMPEFSLRALHAVRQRTVRDLKEPVELALDPVELLVALVDGGLDPRRLARHRSVDLLMRDARELQVPDCRAKRNQEKNQNDSQLFHGENLVAKAGIEPATHGFSVRCSTN